MILRIEETHVDDSTIVLTLIGEADVFTAPQIKQKIIDSIESGIKNFYLDLNGVEYLDCTSLGVLIGGLKRVQPLDGSFNIVCTNKRIMRIFEITGLDKVFTMLDALTVNCEKVN